MQDYPHDYVEVIFVDDGSEDKTLSLIKGYSTKTDLKVKIFHHKWHGLGFSRNLVVQNASGDYIVWVDADMRIPNDYIRKLVEFMENNPVVGIAKGKQSLKVGANLIGTLEAYSRAASRLLNYRSRSAQRKSLGAGGAIYRNEAVRQAGGFDENMRYYYEDFDLELRVRACGWALDVVDAEFCDFERNRISWRSLWEKYWLRGYYARYFVYKNNGVVLVYRMLPISALISGFLDSVKLYKLTCKNIVFLLPIYSFLKMCAWNMGFMSSQITPYQQRKKNQ